MKALVTGGAGFIGSAVVKRILEEEAEVIVLDNLSTGYRENLDNVSATFVEGDIRNLGIVQDLTNDVDTIFHLAACVGNVRSLEKPWEDSEVNVLGTINILEAARKAQVVRIIYSSSAAVFGEPKSLPLDEEHPNNPDSPYGVSKLAGEKHALCFARAYGITVVCLRYFNVYGVNQRYDAYGNVIPIFARRLFEGQPLTIYGDGEQTRDFVNVKDVATANYLAATVRRASGVYNIGAGTATTVNELARLVQKVSETQAKSVDHVPPRSGEVRHCRADITRARADLGFNPLFDLETGLGEYFEWFKTETER